MKKYFVLFAFYFVFSALSFSQQFQISSVDYEISGQTREYALQTKVEIDKKHIFSSKDELEEYIADIKTQIQNTRTFDTVEVLYEIEESKDFTNEDLESKSETAEQNEVVSEDSARKINLVKLTVKTKDSLHFIGTPYAKYKSGDSLSALIKIKDTNFLGSMETLSGEVSFGMELDDDDNPDSYKFGFALDFDTPFKMGAFDAVWGNDLAFSYTIGDSSPEWDFTTGLELTLPFDKFSFVWDFEQSFIRDFDYDEEDKNGTIYKYDDGTYFEEYFKFSIPIAIQEVTNWGKIYYTPFASVTYDWDFNGISEDNEDLLGPYMSFGQTISTSRVNWIENFRNGIDASITQTFGYNFYDYTFNPGFNAEFKAYKAFSRMGFCLDVYGFAYMNGKESFGSRLRGIREDQYFNVEPEDDDINEQKPCKSSAALVVNMDFPIKIARIYWEKVPVINKISFARYFNMEIQLSPFIDFAIFHNKGAGTSFHPKDGFLSGGLEGIVYPLKFKGIQVRGSFGVDLSRKMPKLKNKFNSDWRSNCKAYELSIGIGLHY